MIFFTKFIKYVSTFQLRLKKKTCVHACKIYFRLISDKKYRHCPWETYSRNRWRIRISLGNRFSAVFQYFDHILGLEIIIIEWWFVIIDENVDWLYCSYYINDNVQTKCPLQCLRATETCRLCALKLNRNPSTAFSRSVVIHNRDLLNKTLIKCFVKLNLP